MTFIQLLVLGLLVPINIGLLLPLLGLLLLTLFGFPAILCLRFPTLVCFTMDIPLLVGIDVVGALAAHICFGTVTWSPFVLRNSILVSLVFVHVVALAGPITGAITGPVASVIAVPVRAIMSSW